MEYIISVEVSMCIGGDSNKIKALCERSGLGGGVGGVMTGLSFILLGVVRARWCLTLLCVWSLFSFSGIIESVMSSCILLGDPWQFAYLSTPMLGFSSPVLIISLLNS